MYEIAALTGSTPAVAVVGAVLLEAVALYVAYGAVTRAIGDAVLELVGGEP